MKRYFLFPALLLMVGVAFVACDKNDNVYYPSKNPDRQLSSFFEHSFKPTEEPICFPELISKDTCIVISSMEDLYGIFLCDMVLPEMNFADHSVVIGSHTMPNSFYRVASQHIIDNGTSLTLKLQSTLVSDDGGTYPAFSKMYYYGIYPKLPNKAINVELKIEE